MATTPSASQPADVGVSSTASTVQGEVVCVPARSKDPGWKYCTCPDTTQKNSLRCIFCHNVYKNGITRIKYHLPGIPNVGCNPCLKVPADVKEEILQYLTNKGDKRATKVSEQKRARLQVDLSHSEGEEHGSSDEDGTNTSVVMLKSSRRARSKSSSGPMDKYCELTPEEAIAARKEKRVEKLQSKLTTEKREQKRNRACEYISQWFYEACIPFNAVTLPSFNLMLQSVGQYGEDLEEGSFGRDSAKRQRRNKSFDPAKWWSNHGSSAPNLRVLAMRILSLTCSSSACERNFSVFQQVQTKRRNRLLHDKMRDLVFIKANSQLEQKRGMKERDPIEAKTFADVVEDEDNEWITGIVPVVVVQAEAEPEPEHEGAHVEESTSKRKRVSKPRKKKKVLPVYRDDELQSAGSSSESEDGAMHSPFSSSDSE